MFVRSYIIIITACVEQVSYDECVEMRGYLDLQLNVTRTLVLS